MEGQPGQKNQTLEEPEGSPEGAGGTRLCSAEAVLGPQGINQAGGNSLELA